MRLDGLKYTGKLNKNKHQAKKYLFIFLCILRRMEKSHAITLAGSQSELARILGITRAAVHHWKSIPTKRLNQLKTLKPDWFKGEE